MKHRVLIFDFDGTLADTGDIAVRVYNEIARKNHLPVLNKEVLPKLQNLGAREAIRFMNVPLLKLPFIATRVRSALKKEVPSMKPFPNMKDTLYALKEKGDDLFVVSSNSVENIKEFLKRNQMEIFDGVYSVSSIFGKHAKLRTLIRTHSWDPASVMYIGDEVRDIETARKAGVTSVAVTWGFNTKEALIAHRPDVVLETPAELAAL